MTKQNKTNNDTNTDIIKRAFNRIDVDEYDMIHNIDDLFGIDDMNLNNKQKIKLLEMIKKQQIGGISIKIKTKSRKTKSRKIKRKTKSRKIKGKTKSRKIKRKI